VAVAAAMSVAAVAFAALHAAFEGRQLAFALRDQLEPAG